MCCLNEVSPRFSNSPIDSRCMLRAQFKHAANRDTQGGLDIENGLRFRGKLLEAPSRMATYESVETFTRSTHPLTSGRANQLVAHDARMRFFCPSAGPIPTVQRKAGNKHHFIADARGILLATTLTSANDYDVKQLLPWPAPYRRCASDTNLRTAVY
jgi:hypothetical protein